MQSPRATICSLLPGRASSRARALYDSSWGPDASDDNAAARRDHNAALCTDREASAYVNGRTTVRAPLLAVTAAAAGLTACADSNTADLSRNVWESNPAGAKGLLRGGELQYVQVAQIVSSFVPSSVGNVTVSARNDVDQETALDHAIALFYQAYKDDPARAALLRNEIEDRLIAASNQRCGFWENYLLTSTSNVGFWSGLVGTAANAASIAFSPVATKDALTAIASTTTDVGTEFNKNYLYGETMQVIVQGVETRRTSIYTSIREHEISGNGTYPSSIEVYSLSAAIGDALSYHAACSMASGLQEASESLSDQRPGNVTTVTTGNATTVTTGHVAARKGAPAPAVQIVSTTTINHPTASPGTVPLAPHPK
jgi:hypothetical protein